MMKRLADSFFKGGILADAMGLGKTLQIITTCEMLERVPGAFNLIVTTKTCADQWKHELKKNFHPVIHAPLPHEQDG